MGEHRGVTDVVDRSQGPDRLRRLGVAAAVLSFVGIWGYVLYLSFFVGRADPRDRLEDAEWVATAEAVCAPTTSAISRLGYASELHDPLERAELLDDATTRLEGMVARLRSLSPPDDPAEARAVGRWLDDWEEYNRNRRDYADAFRAGEDEPFVVTERGGYQIDVVLEDFAAKANEMPSCAPPDDVG